VLGSSSFNCTQGTLCVASYAAVGSTCAGTLHCDANHNCN
jgi:hypothetical protein